MGSTPSQRQSPRPALSERLPLTINVRSMGELKLYGMRSAYDEVMGAGIKRQHEPRALSAIC